MAALFSWHAGTAQDAYRPSGNPLPSWGLKTNLLNDATTTLNLGAELRLNRKTTFELPVSYNPWTFSDNKKWKHLLVQPELRRWTCEAFNGAFWGVHAHYGVYNVSGLPTSLFSTYMNEHRFEGWLAGAGVSYGYHWMLRGRWSLEATLGIGYAYLSYDKYPCAKCGQKIGTGNRNYFGPTKAAVSLIYMIK